MNLGPNPPFRFAASPLHLQGGLTYVAPNGARDVYRAAISDPRTFFVKSQRACSHGSSNPRLLRQKTLAHVALKRQNHGVFSYKGFDHIALVTRNLTAMKTFYCDGLGLAMEQESKAKAGYNIVTLRAGDAVLDLFEAGPTNPAPSANLSEE